MKQNCIKTVAISLLVTLSLSINASTRKVNVARSVMVGNGIAKFVPDGFDAKKVPSFAIEKEPREQGALSSGWELVPDFSLTDGKAIINHTGRYEYLRRRRSYRISFKKRKNHKTVEYRFGSIRS